MASSVILCLTRNPDLYLPCLRGDKEGVKGLPRSFQSLAMAGMPVSLRGTERRSNLLAYNRDLFAIVRNGGHKKKMNCFFETTMVFIYKGYKE